MPKTALFVRETPGGIYNIEDQATTTGNRYFVCSTTGSDAAGWGLSPDKPTATIDYAIGLCTANQGDLIFVMPGHTESLATLITADVAGITIKGLGNGNDRPKVTVNAVIDGISITADNVTLENLVFPDPTAAAASMINVAAAKAKVKGCRFELGADTVDAVTITAAGEEPTFEDNVVIVQANGPDSWLKFEGVIDKPVIVRNIIIGSDGTDAFDDGMFDFNNQAVTNLVMRDNVFGDGNQAVTVFANGGNVVGEAIGPNSYAALAVAADTTGVTLASFANDSITAAAIAANAIDAGAIAAGAIDAATFAAGAIDAAAIATDAIDADAIADNAIDAGAIAADAITNAKVADNTLASEQFATSSAEKTCDGQVVTRATAALPQTTAAAIFTVTGLCLVKRIVGHVTTAVGNVPNATKLKVNSTGAGATTDICATVDLDNAAVDSYLQITGTFGNAMVKTVDIPIAKQQATEIVVPPGTIEVDCGGSDGGGGRVKWSVTYVPLEAGAGIVAA